MKSLICSRFGNPPIMAVEDKIAELEGSIGAMCTTSGQVAVLLSVNLFSFTLKKLDIECIYIDKNPSDQDIDKAFKSNTKAEI